MVVLPLDQVTVADDAGTAGKLPDPPVLPLQLETVPVPPTVPVRWPHLTGYESLGDEADADPANANVAAASGTSKAGTRRALPVRERNMLTPSGWFFGRHYSPPHWWCALADVASGPC